MGRAGELTDPDRTTGSTRAGDRPCGLLPYSTLQLHYFAYCVWGDWERGRGGGGWNLPSRDTWVFFFFLSCLTGRGGIGFGIGFGGRQAGRELHMQIGQLTALISDDLWFLCLL